MKVPRLLLAISSREKIVGVQEIGKSSEHLCCILNYNNQPQALLCKQIVCYCAADLERFDVVLDEHCFPGKQGQIIVIPLNSCEANKENGGFFPLVCLTKIELNCWV